MRNRVLAALAGIMALGVCITASAAPIEAYSRLPAMSNVRLSDNGQNVAYVTSRDGQLRVMVQQLSDGAALAVLDLGDAKIRDVEWGSPNHVVIIVSSTTAIPYVTFVGELYQAVSLDIRTGQAVQLMQRAGGSTTYATVLAGWPSYGTHDGDPVMYVEAIHDEPQTRGDWRLDLIRVDLDDGETHQHQMGSKSAHNFLVQPDGTLLARQNFDYDTREWSLEARVGGSMRVVHRVRDTLESPYLGGLTADGQSLIVDLWDSTNQVYRPTPLSMQTGQFGEPILPPNDVAVLYNESQRMVGYAENGVYTRYNFTDSNRAAAWERIRAVFPNRQISIESNTPDFSRVIVYVEGTGYPGNYIMYDAASSRMTQIGRTRPDLTPADIAEVRSITYRAADGLEIQAYLTLPPGRDPTNLPLVVMPHGGPQSRDIAGFDWIAQSLASRGYAVLQPNFRGSEGFGNAFVEAAYGEWGRKMQTDLSDGVTYLAGRGMIDASRVCIMGASYGGYAALAGVTLQSGVYRCSVAIAPVADVRDFMDWIVRRNSSESDRYLYWQRYIGFSNLNDPLLNEISPVRHAGNASAPVLLIHGRDDTVVPFSHSAGMERALRSAGKPVELVTLREEDHWLSREATRMQTMSAALAFLERHNPPN
ncbi:alpha/beta hydrolase family protein [Terricaulis silvestris]|uniref:Prolyl tripeptidyl peptidase n=1 Tax=Terricaulis silvestris TaxID=2686094 RepID=A0A6I6MTG7_9CAUL|nr:S9 family peptidase [Terricaulis silvestris]QGZ95002.1 Prolyl tripeptidyl peptidase precursor [Terricaulis silvestris]